MPDYEYRNEDFKARRGLLEVQRLYLDFRENVIRRVGLRDMMEVASLTFAPTTKDKLKPGRVHPVDTIETLALTWARNGAVGVPTSGWQQPFEARSFSVGEDGILSTEDDVGCLRRDCDLGFYPLQDFQHFRKVPTKAGSLLRYPNQPPARFEVVMHPQPRWIDLTAGRVEGLPAVWFRIPFEFRKCIEIEPERNVNAGDLLATITQDCHVWCAVLHPHGRRKGHPKVQKIMPRSIPVTRYSRMLRVGLHMGEECVSAVLGEIPIKSCYHQLPRVYEERDDDSVSYAVDSPRARKDLTQAVGLGSRPYFLRSGHAGNFVRCQESKMYPHLKEVVVASHGHEHVQVVPEPAVLHDHVVPGCEIQKGQPIADAVPRLGWTSWPEVEAELGASANTILADFVRQQLILPGERGYIGTGFLHPCEYIPTELLGFDVSRRYLDFAPAEQHYVATYGAVILPPFFHSHVGNHVLNTPTIRLAVRKAALRTGHRPQRLYDSKRVLS